MSKYIMIFSILLSVSCNSGKKLIENQRMYDKKDYELFSSDDYCGIGDSSILIGKTMKIYHTGGIYSKIGESRKHYFDNYNLQKQASKKKWGYNFEPRIGMVGKVVGVSKFQYGNPHSGQRIIIMQINGNHVAIGCGYIVSESEMDSKEYDQFYSRKSEIEAIEYANGCVFRSLRFNDCYNGAGLTEFDRVSENFACSLVGMNIDTILLAKNIYDNGRSKTETGFVAWKNESQEILLRHFYQDSLGIVYHKDSKAANHQIFNSELVTMDKPGSNIRVSHSMGYVVTLKVGDDYLCDRYTHFERKFSTDVSHPKWIYWNEIEKIDKNLN